MMSVASILTVSNAHHPSCTANFIQSQHIPKTRQSLNNSQTLLSLPILDREMNNHNGHQNNNDPVRPAQSIH